jgi:hypothetical protein
MPVDGVGDAAEPWDLVVVVEDQLTGVGNAVVGVHRALPHRYDRGPASGLGPIVVDQLGGGRPVDVRQADKGGRGLDSILGCQAAELERPLESIETGGVVGHSMGHDRRPFGLGCFWGSKEANSTERRIHSSRAVWSSTMDGGIARYSFMGLPATGSKGLASRLVRSSSRSSGDRRKKSWVPYTPALDDGERLRDLFEDPDQLR